MGGVAYSVVVLCTRKVLFISGRRRGLFQLEGVVYSIWEESFI